MEKAKNAGISLYPGEIEKLRTRAGLKDGGSPTRYFRRLFKADMENTPVPTSFDDQILVKLAQTYAGYLAPRLAGPLAAAQADQPTILYMLLERYCQYLSRGGDPLGFVIGHAREWTAADALPAAAEDQAAYAKPGLDTLDRPAKPSAADLLAHERKRRERPHSVSPTSGAERTAAPIPKTAHPS